MLKNRRMLMMAIVVVVVGLIALADALQVFDDKPYSIIPHGSHNHYVPKDRDPNVDLDAFPTRPPNDDEYITPQGEIKKKQ